MDINHINSMYKAKTTNASYESKAKTKYSKAMQNKIAQEFMAGGISKLDLAINYNVTCESITKWLAKYSAESYEGDYTEEQRVMAVNLSKQCGIREIARRVGIPVAAVGAMLK